MKNLMFSKSFLFQSLLNICLVSAGVLDVDAVSTSSFSQATAALNVADSVVYHIKGAVGSGLTIVQVDGPSTCHPVNGGYSFPKTPQNGTVYINFQNPGTFYISTVEGCSAGQISTVTVAAPPVNPYTLQAKILLEQVVKQHQSTQSSASTCALSSTFALAAIAAVVFAL